ncbi:MAG: replicative DNA helicase [Sinobacteraceae bacterium]|nr:replicative DNA helicase [Nevskiaceae bacterium]
MSSVTSIHPIISTLTPALDRAGDTDQDFDHDPRDDLKPAADAARDVASLVSPACAAETAPAGTSTDTAGLAGVAERHVLAELLRGGDALARIEPPLSSEDFRSRFHRQLYDAICAVDSAGHSIDRLTVAHQLEQEGHLQGWGGLDGLDTLLATTTAPGELSANADIVRDQALTRRLHSVGTRMVEMSRQSGDPHTKLDQAQALLATVADKGLRNGPRVARDWMPDVLNEVDRKLRMTDGCTGLTTGFPALDKLTAGLHPGELTIIGGRPSMGKTSLAMQIAGLATVDNNLPVLVFSFEMSANSLLTRLIAGRAGLDLQSLRNGTAANEVTSRFTDASAEVNKAPLFIDESSEMSVLEIRAHARRIQREHGLSLIVIDYLQLMEGHNRRNNSETRSQEVARISRQLKRLAQELSIPLILLSQLNRGCEMRDDKRPMMSDLRESGGIEQDADLIILVYRDVVYHPSTHNPNLAELIIAKQRNGPVGTVFLDFNGGSCVFTNSAGPIGRYNHRSRTSQRAGFNPFDDD